MEAVKVNNDLANISLVWSGFCCKIGGTLFNARVYTGSGYADMLEAFCRKHHRLICFNPAQNTNNSPQVGKLLSTIEILDKLEYLM